MGCAQVTRFVGTACTLLFRRANFVPFVARLATATRLRSPRMRLLRACWKWRDRKLTRHAFAVLCLLLRCSCSLFSVCSLSLLLQERKKETHVEKRQQKPRFGLFVWCVCAPLLFHSIACFLLVCVCALTVSIAMLSLFVCSVSVSFCVLCVVYVVQGCAPFPRRDHSSLDV